MQIEFGDYRLDTDSRELNRGGARIDLEPRGFDLLAYLIEHRGRAVAKAELQDKIWGTVVGDAAIAQCVKKVRRALGDSAAGPEIVRTVRGHGYRFVANLGKVPLTAQAHDAIKKNRVSIAVLPLRNLSDDAETNYFGDGIAEEILTLLARVPQLRVVSRTSSFCFRNRDTDIRSIGRELNATFVLEGSLRRAHDRVRINVNLIDAEQDTQLWAQRYDRQLTDIFALQAEIASAIVDELKIATRGETRRYDATQSLEAYDFYLRGRYYFHQWDEQAIRYSREMYEQAIALDPNFARAWAGLADTLTCVAMWMDSDGSMTQRADEANQRALSLAPELAEAHCARGFTLSNQHQYSASAACFETALQLDPMLFEASYLYARSCFAAGELAQAAQLFGRAAEIRLDDYQARCLQAQTFAALGDTARAEAAARDAVQRCRKQLALHPDDTRALTLGAGCLIRLGQRQEGLQWTQRALQLGPDDITVLHNVGCTYAEAGEIDSALEVFQRRFAMGSFLQDWIDNDPDFDNLRDDPRFIAMLASGRRA